MPFNIVFDTNVCPLQNHLHRLDDKFSKAMVNNAQLDNEKQALTYQVDLYKDDIQELEENLIRLQKDYKDKCRVSVGSLSHFTYFYHIL